MVVCALVEIKTCAISADRRPSYRHFAARSESVVVHKFKLFVAIPLVRFFSLLYIFFGKHFHFYIVIIIYIPALALDLSETQLDGIVVRS